MKFARIRKNRYLQNGLRITVMVLCILFGFLFNKVILKISTSREIERKRAYICTVKRNIEAGQVLKTSDVEKIPVFKDTKDISLIEYNECVGKQLKQSLKKGSILTSYVICDAAREVHNIRKVPYTFIRNGDTLKKGDFIDVRISFPNGADFSLLGKKEVLRVEEISSGTERRLWLGLTEEEILRMSSAVVDAYLFENAYIYAVTYMNSLQDAVVVNYPVNEVVEKLIKKNPNIIKIAQDKKTLELRKEIYVNTPAQRKEDAAEKESLMYFD